MSKRKIIFLISSIFLVFIVAVIFSYSSVKKEIEIENPSISLEDEKEIPSEPHPDSIPAMAEKEFLGDSLKLENVLSENDLYTRYYITYNSEGLEISGIINIPKGEGPFPILILNHGYIDPEFYTNGQGLKREQDYFARNRYVVLHSDYRGYAFSDPDPDGNIRPRTDYVEDVLNAISAVKKSDIKSLDKENIGMLGHSMGGGIAENIMVTKPDIAKAYVLLAPINADYLINFKKWVEPDPDFEGIAEKFYERYGTYEENPELWESFSAINYIGNIKSPVMLHQGDQDKDVPVEWSRNFAKALENSNKDITYHEYPGEGHTFYNAQSLVMQRSLDFFDKNLKND